MPGSRKRGGTSSKRKRSENPSSPVEMRIIVSDIEVKINKHNLTGGHKEVDRLPSDFRVSYALKLSDKSHNSSKRITITSTKEVCDDTEGNVRCELTRALEMKLLVVAALERHKLSAE